MTCLLGITPGPPIAIQAEHKHDLLITGRAPKMSSSLQCDLLELKMSQRDGPLSPLHAANSGSDAPGAGNEQRECDLLALKKNVALVSMRLSSTLGADENPSQDASKGVTAEKEYLPFDRAGRKPEQPKAPPDFHHGPEC